MTESAGTENRQVSEHGQQGEGEVGEARIERTSGTHAELASGLG